MKQKLNTYFPLNLKFETYKPIQINYFGLLYKN